MASDGNRILQSARALLSSALSQDELNEIAQVIGRSPTALTGAKSEGTILAQKVKHNPRFRNALATYDYITTIVDFLKTLDSTHQKHTVRIPGRLPTRNDAKLSQRQQVALTRVANDRLFGTASALKNGLFKVTVSKAPTLLSSSPSLSDPHTTIRPGKWINTFSPRERFSLSNNNPIRALYSVSRNGGAPKPLLPETIATKSDAGVDSTATFGHTMDDQPLFGHAVADQLTTTLTSSVQLYPSDKEDEVDEADSALSDAGTPSIGYLFATPPPGNPKTAASNAASNTASVESSPRVQTTAASNAASGGDGTLNADIDDDELDLLEDHEEENPFAYTDGDPILHGPYAAHDEDGERKAWRVREPDRDVPPIAYVPPVPPPISVGAKSSQQVETWSPPPPPLPRTGSDESDSDDAFQSADDLDEGELEEAERQRQEQQARDEAARAEQKAREAEAERQRQEQQARKAAAAAAKTERQRQDEKAAKRAADLAEMKKQAARSMHSILGQPGVQQIAAQKGLSIVIDADGMRRFASVASTLDEPDIEDVDALTGVDDQTVPALETKQQRVFLQNPVEFALDNSTAFNDKKRDMAIRFAVMSEALRRNLIKDTPSQIAAERESIDLAEQLGFTGEIQIGNVVVMDRDRYKQMLTKRAASIDADRMEKARRRVQEMTDKDSQRLQKKITERHSAHVPLHSNASRRSHASALKRNDPKDVTRAMQSVQNHPISFAPTLATVYQTSGMAAIVNDALSRVVSVEVEGE